MPLTHPHWSGLALAGAALALTAFALASHISTWWALLGLADYFAFIALAADTDRQHDMQSEKQENSSGVSTPGIRRLAKQIYGLE